MWNTLNTYEIKCTLNTASVSSLNSCISSGNSILSQLKRRSGAQIASLGVRASAEALNYQPFAMSRLTVSFGRPCFQLSPLHFFSPFHDIPGEIQSFFNACFSSLSFILMT